MTIESGTLYVLYVKTNVPPVRPNSWTVTVVPGPPERVDALQAVGGGPVVVDVDVDVVDVDVDVDVVDVDVDVVVSGGPWQM